MNFDPSLPDDEVNVSGTHPLREALVLVAGIAGVGLALFAVIAMAVEAAREKIRRKGCDRGVSNVASENLGTEEGKVTLVAPRSKPIEVGPAVKPELARHIIAWAATKLSR